MVCNEKNFSALAVLVSVVVHLNFFMRWFLSPYQCPKTGDVVGRGGQALDDRYDPRADAKDQHVLCSGYRPTPRPSLPPSVMGAPLQPVSTKQSRWCSCARPPAAGGVTHGVQREMSPHSSRGIQNTNPLIIPQHPAMTRSG
jgi:hypothetical protein